jgi:hypothetical protein
VSSTLGYNFYDLRAPVFLLYPVNTPFRNTLAREGRVNDGYGTAAHWMATRDVGSVYGGVAEGKRGGVATPDKHDYVASYKEIGVERAVTFTAQFAGEGFADNLADEHLRGLHELWLQEEGIIINGNSGIATGMNGYTLKTAPTPVCATNGATSAITTPITVYLVTIAPMGMPRNTQYGYGVSHTVAGGLVPSYPRTNADGTTDTISGGTSIVSAASNTTSGSPTSVTVTLPANKLPVKGAAAYAWFVSTSNAPTLANAYLTAITTNPSVTITAALLAASRPYAANDPLLQTDYSYSTLDFDGIYAYAVNAGGWTDLYGGSLKSEANGRITDFETILQSIFDNYQTQPDEIWCSSDAAVAVDAAIKYNGSTPTGYQWMYNRDSQNNVLGGFVVSAYQSRFAVNNPTGGNAIPIRIHPMMPAGTIYFHMKTNPYPHSRQAQVMDMLVQRDYYSVEWPQVTRQWPHGTYCHEVLRHNMPWVSQILTGVGVFTP